MAASPCPAGSFRYNGTLCACGPGRFLSAGGGCSEFDAPPGVSAESSGVGIPGPAFLSAVLPLDSIQRLTPSQAALLVATLVTVAIWLIFCAAVRMGRVDGGRSVWFRIRWSISRLDFFDAHHWLVDRQVVRRRKTELGGTFSVASWITFVGLLSALVYQILTQGRVEVHRVRPANAPDLQSYAIDMEFNITAVSSMSCSHLRGLDTMMSGFPGFIDYKELPLSTYVNFSCHNSSMGPIVSFTCNSCRIPQRNYYISWYFADLPNDPAMAVGFIFNLTAKDHGGSRHMTSFAGTLKSDSLADDTPRTFRGAGLNILNINLFPEIYNNLHNLKIIRPMFHDFVPGTFFTDERALQSSLQDPKSGIVNTTLYISYISDFIVEIDNSNLNRPVDVLANIGGLYSISLAIFLYLLCQCEARIKKLRNEDYVMVDIKTRKRAQRNWDKLRKYVMYTWGFSNLDGNQTRRKRRRRNSMIDSFRRIGSMQKTKQPSRKESQHIGMMEAVPVSLCAGRDGSSLALKNGAYGDGKLTFTGIEEATFDIDELPMNNSRTLAIL